MNCKTLPSLLLAALPGLASLKVLMALGQPFGLPPVPGAVAGHLAALTAQGSVADAGIPSSLGPALTGATGPTALTFSLKGKQRLYEAPLAKGNRFRIFEHDFAANLGTPWASQAVSGPGPSVGFAGGVETATFFSGTDIYLSYLPAQRFEAPYLAVQVAMKSLTGTPTNDDVGAGLTKASDPGNNWLLAIYDKSGPSVYLSQNVAGTSTTIGSVVTLGAPLTEPFSLFLSVNENYATAWVDQGNGPVPYVTARVTGIDLTDPAVLAAWAPARFYAPINGNATFACTGFRAGYSGTTGSIAITPVTWDDGSPYVREGKLYFGVGNCGLGDNATSFQNVRTIHQSVWRVDQRTRQWEEVGKLFCKRADGHVYGDNNASLVVERSTGRVHVTVATWGSITDTGGVGLLYAAVDGDVLHGAHVVTFGAAVTLPSGSGAYDPCVRKIGGQWYTAYTATSTANISTWQYYPVLAQGLPNAMTLVGAGANGQEGTRIVTVGATSYVTAASAGNGSTPYHVYNVTASGGSLGVLGTLNCPATGSAIPPHATVVPVREQGATRYAVVTFDADPVFGKNWSGGNVFWYESAETNAGFEFPIYAPCY